MVEVSNAHSSSRQSATGRILEVISFVIAMVIYVLVVLGMFGVLFDHVEQAKQRCQAMTTEPYPGYLIRACYWSDEP